MTAPLIGLLGRKRSGKDSVAAVLVEERGFVRFAFADPLRAALLDLDPVVRVEHDELGPLRPEIQLLGGGVHWIKLSFIVGAVGWERAKGLREVRRLLQAHGHAIRERVGEDVWVRATMEQVERAGEPWPCMCSYPCDPARCPDYTPGSSVVITDVRYPNEAEAIKLAGGTLVRVLRPGLASTDEHVSETGLDGWTVDKVILNDGSLDDLRVKVERHLIKC